MLASFRIASVSGNEIVPQVPDVDDHVDTLERVVIAGQRVPVGEEGKRRAGLGICEGQLAGAPRFPKVREEPVLWREAAPAVSPRTMQNRPTLAISSAASVDLLSEGPLLSA